MYYNSVERVCCIIVCCRVVSSGWYIGVCVVCFIIVCCIIASSGGWYYLSGAALQVHGGSNCRHPLYLSRCRHIHHATHRLELHVEVNDEDNENNDDKECIEEGVFVGMMGCVITQKSNTQK